VATLREFRQYTARLLGGYEDRGAISTSGDRTCTGGGTALLVEARWPILRQRVASDFYAGALLYRTGEGATPTLVAADRVRQIGLDGYIAAEGRFVPDSDWQNAPINGEHYELHTHGFDPYGQLTMLINEALRAITLVVDVAFSPDTDDKGAYVPTLDADGLALGSWLVRPAQILSLRTTATPGPSYAINGYAGRADLRGTAWADGSGKLYLAPLGAPLGTATELWARVYKPAYEHCRFDNGAAFGSQAGFVPGADEGEAVPAALWVAAGAIALAWERFPDVLDASGARARAMTIEQAKTTFYREQDAYYRQVAPDATFAPLEAVG
jgi:hypothetical protein